MNRVSRGFGLVLAAWSLALAGLPQPVARAADTTPPTGAIVINKNHSATNTPNVTLALTWDDGAGGSGVSRMRFSDDGAHWSAWETLAAARSYTLPGADGYKTVRVQYLDKANNRSAAYSDYIRLDTTLPTGTIVINGGAATTDVAPVTLGLTWADGAGAGVSRMRLSDNGSTWTAWMPPEAAPARALPGGLGYHTVRVQYLDGANNYSAVYSDYIKLVSPGPGLNEMLPVAADDFTMGRTASGDDLTYGLADELPAHPVLVSAYEIGKYEVTTRQYCDVLNWAFAQGYLLDSAGGAWTGTGDLYAGGYRRNIIGITQSDCTVRYSQGVFSPKTRTGLPGATAYPMDNHPVVWVSWHGAVAFCNWLSQMQGLPACYNMNAANWPLTLAPPTPGGYRLPTEAEWERASAWDGSKHWTYGYGSDTFAGASRVNYWVTSVGALNPLGLALQPFISPVGWFNGVNVNPNGSLATERSESPVGACDMSGNVLEWCGDWYGAYGFAGVANPTGPASGSYRVLRGGAWDYLYWYSRTASRYYNSPEDMRNDYGFRLARTP